MIEVYKDVFTRKGAVFHEDVFHYAKAINCMKWISILKVCIDILQQLPVQCLSEIDVNYSDHGCIDPKNMFIVTD